MKTLLLFTALACIGAPNLPLRAQPGRHEDEKHEGRGGRGRGHDRDDHRDYRESRGHEEYSRGYFRPADRVIILDHYKGPKHLPKGLEKKLYRTGTLPPGWERRFHPLPVVVVQQMPPLCATCQAGIIDGCAVVYDRRTRIILDVLALTEDIVR